MGDVTCAEDGCTNKPARQGRGHCHKHYLAKLADGSLPRLRKSYYESVTPERCSVDDCEKRPTGRGYCATHYLRWRKHGDPTKVVVRTQTACRADNCDRAVVAQGVCGTHLYRLRKFGSTELPEPKTPIERFEEQVDATAGPQGCHPWTGSCDADGYGLFNADRRTYRATRWILGRERGRPLTKDEWALHHCDNPPCVNLAHLYVGDATQNAADRERRGRGGAGRRPLPTHCRNRHEYTPENVYFEAGKRRCLTCRNARHGRKYEKLKRLRAAA